MVTYLLVLTESSVDRTRFSSTVKGEQRHLARCRKWLFGAPSPHFHCSFDIQVELNANSILCIVHVRKSG